MLPPEKGDRTAVNPGGPEEQRAQKCRYQQFFRLLPEGEGSPIIHPEFINPTFRFLAEYCIGVKSQKK